MTIDGNPFRVHASTPIELVDNDDLDAVEEQFRAGVISWPGIRRRRRSSSRPTAGGS